jgi:hypothetical protein
MAKKDIYLIGGVAVTVAGLYYANQQGWLEDIKAKIGEMFGGAPEVPIDDVTPPPIVNSFAAAGEWGGALAQPVADTIIRNKPDLVVGLGGYNDNEGKFKPVVNKFDKSKIPAIWARGSESDDYLNLFGQSGWEFKYEPQGISFCVLNSVNVATLEDMLKTSTAKFKIVVVNAPLYSPTSKYGQDVTAQEKLMPLLIKYKVGLVLSAKNKLYYRYIPKGGPNTTVGVTFVGVGTASDMFDPAGSPNGAIQIIEGKPGYLRVDVGATLTCKFLSVQGLVLDTFTVNEWK